ncbi:outer membrane protein Omp28 [bacterium BMS3Abin03]|nr:outer membrane protein Omp28 [bacterium BMS3Abin03]
MKKQLQILFLFSSVFFVIGGFNLLIAQTQRNPVLEEVTGTWCQWCPCGHQVMAQILEDMPNAIMIGYHGPANGSDPFSYFQGNAIISYLGYNAYPTAVIDRTGPPMSRGAWPGKMNLRYDVPATVSITLDKTYNKTTRELNATVSVTALENLTGEYKMNMILLEDGLIHSQSGNGSCPGGSNYVHNHVVRSMINGALGDELNGAAPWNTGEIISKNVQYTVPSDFVADSCQLVVLVYEVQSPLYNGEIQQAEKWTLVSPDYAATIASTSPDVIEDNNTPAEFTTVLHNEGLLDDMYYIDLTIDGPTGWAGEYTTVNGTFPTGQIDSVEVAAGDSTTISVTINPNGINGFGKSQLGFASKNSPGLNGSVLLRNVTTTGVDILVVDASIEGYGILISNSLDDVYTGNYGIVSREALQAPAVDLSHFMIITWSAGIAIPVFYPEEVDALQNYIDVGGRLFINGQNIGADIFEPGGNSQFAQDFYNNYLHANYEANAGSSYLLKGYDGDPITDGLTFVLGDVYDRSPDKISPYDSDATPILKFLNGPDVAAIRAATTDNRVVYFGIGFEQIDDVAIRDTLMSRIITWLKEGIISSIPEENTIAKSFYLGQNYPNPFNPATRIVYSLSKRSPVSIKVYDLTGQEVTILVDEVKDAGVYQVNFDAGNLSSGVYFYKMVAGEFMSVKKMSIIK